jgi:opacity protein-like surface antigen
MLMLILPLLLNKPDLNKIIAMKKITLILIACMATCGIFAQNAANKIVTLSINGGTALPVGNFSKADYADLRSGYASAGGHFNITGTYYFNKNWGVGVLVGYSKFGHTGSQSLSDGYKEDSGTDSTTLYLKGNNHSLSVLIGPYYRIHAGNKFSVDVRVLGGYVNTHLAGFQVFYEDYTDNAMSQKESSGGGFGFQVGAGINYQLTKTVAIKANGDYFSSKPKMDIGYDNFVVNSGRRLGSYDQAINGIDLTLGFAFNLFGR